MPLYLHIHDMIGGVTADAAAHGRLADRAPA
jgi:hypothetical protein